MGVEGPALIQQPLGTGQQGGEVGRFEFGELRIIGGIRKLRRRVGLVLLML